MPTYFKVVQSKDARAFETFAKNVKCMSEVDDKFCCYETFLDALITARMAADSPSDVTWCDSFVSYEVDIPVPYLKANEPKDYYASFCLTSPFILWEPNNSKPAAHLLRFFGLNMTVRPIENPKLCKYMNLFLSECEKAVSFDVMNLRYIPHEFRTPAIYGCIHKDKITCENFEAVLQEIPKEYITRDMAEHLLRMCTEPTPERLRYWFNEEKTSLTYGKRAQKIWNLLPSKVKDESLRKLYVKLNGWVQVPKKKVFAAQNPLDIEIDFIKEKEKVDGADEESNETNMDNEENENNDNTSDSASDSATNKDGSPKPREQLAIRDEDEKVTRVMYYPEYLSNGTYVE